MNARRNSGSAGALCPNGERVNEQAVEARRRGEAVASPARSHRASLAALFVLLLVASPTSVLAQALAQPGSTSAVAESSDRTDRIDAVAARLWRCAAVQAVEKIHEGQRGSAMRPWARPRRLLPMRGLPAPRAP